MTRWQPHRALWQVPARRLVPARRGARLWSGSRQGFVRSSIWTDQRRARLSSLQMKRPRRAEPRPRLRCRREGAGAENHSPAPPQKIPPKLGGCPAAPAHPQYASHRGCKMKLCYRAAASVERTSAGRAALRQAASGGGAARLWHPRRSDLPIPHRGPFATAARWRAPDLRHGRPRE